MKSLLYIPFLCLAFASAAQHARFNYAYDYGGSEVMRGIKTVDSGYLTVCELYQTGVYHILINKFDLNGQPLWDRKYLLDPAGHGIGLNSITADVAGNYWICGWIIMGTDTTNAYAFSFSPEGDSLWFIRDTTTFQVLNAIVPKSNGNVVVAGFDRKNVSNAKVMLAEWDSAGNVLWKKTYYQPSGYSSVGWSLASTPDGGYVIGASIGQSIDVDPRVIKTDSAGNMQWDRRFDNTDWGETGASVLVSSDGFIYAGSTITKEKLNGSTYYSKGFLAKLAMNSQVIWSKEYGQALLTNGFLQLKEDRAGNILAVARSQQLDDSLGALHGWLLKVNPEGDSLWEKRYRFNYDTTLECINYAWSLDTTGDGGMVTGGKVTCSDTVNNTNFQDLWIVKFDSNGCFDSINDCTTGFEEIRGPAQATNALKIWPNPSTGTFTIDVKTSDVLEVRLCDWLGHRWPVNIDANNGFYVADYPAGLYIVEAKTADGWRWGKLILQRK